MSALPDSLRTGVDLPPGPGESTSYDEESSRAVALERCNRLFSELDPVKRIEWALEHLPSNHVLTSSFGAQAAVSLHLVTRVYPDIPVILIDTGYLFPETYRFVDELTEKLKLNLKVYRAELSPAWQEARYGQRWNQGLEGLNAYNEENKVEPMRRALRELGANTWFAGLRRKQSASRASIPFLDWAGGRWKVHPIADWTDRDVHYYLKENGLPYHPLWEKGYVSIGDVHSTKPIHEVEAIEQTRFFGLKRECGIHEINLADL
ncbi:MAG: phosphoadenylyl-sulfate reductase [Gammaproteobacteria bacterium]|nr:phosphoadenosine phosphosulfate reductase [Gammaproteobacteria bacterium]